jgi:hypothetical protein
VFLLLNIAANRRVLPWPSFTDARDVSSHPLLPPLEAIEVDKHVFETAMTARFLTCSRRRLGIIRTSPPFTSARIAGELSPET